jgi:hypothetical protein
MMKKISVVLLILLVLVLAACSGNSDDAMGTPAHTAAPDQISPEGDSPTDTPEPDTAEITPTICPQATPEWLRVRPVTSPTSELTQTIYISINNGEAVTVTTPAGEFEATAESGIVEEDNFRYNYVVEIDLLPGTEQELTVQTRIQQIERDGCNYGGYPLTTKVDINIEPLVIIQE